MQPGLGITGVNAFHLNCGQLACIFITYKLTGNIKYQPTLGYRRTSGHDFGERHRPCDVSNIVWEVFGRRISQIMKENSDSKISKTTEKYF